MKMTKDNMAPLHKPAGPRHRNGKWTSWNEDSTTDPAFQTRSLKSVLGPTAGSDTCKLLIDPSNSSGDGIMTLNSGVPDTRCCCGGSAGVHGDRRFWSGGISVAFVSLMNVVLAVLLVVSCKLSYDRARLPNLTLTLMHLATTLVSLRCVRARLSGDLRVLFVLLDAIQNMSILLEHC